MKQVALAFGIVLAVLAVAAAATNWEPHSTTVEAHIFVVIAIVVCVPLISYGKMR